MSKKKTKPVTIMALQVENFKRIVVAEMQPDGSLIVIGGDNAQGKSSLIDAIMAALGGKGKIPPMPITKGADKGGIKLTLSNGLRVIRTLSPDGKHTLKVTNEDGARYDSPQKMLDAMFSTLSFDACEFANMDKRAAAVTLQGLVGLDFTDHDSLRKGLFDDRTDVNRRVRDMKGNIKLKPEHDVPDELVSASELAGELETALQTNSGHESQRVALRTAIEAIPDIEESITEMETAHAQLLQAVRESNEEIQSAKQNLVDAKKNTDAKQVEIDALEDVDTEPIRAKINEADTINEQVRSNRDRKNMVSDCEATEQRSDEMTDKLAKMDADRVGQLAAAKMPIDGLDFGPDGVLYQGVPFEQASQSDRDMVSVAIGLALNPDAPVVLIREASRWDAKTLKRVGKMAKDADAQVWCERVSQGKECTVIIEDGQIKGA